MAAAMPTEPSQDVVSPPKPSPGRKFSVQECPEEVSDRIQGLRLEKAERRPPMRRRSGLRWVIWIVVLAVGAAGAKSGWDYFQQATGSNAVPVDAVRVTTASEAKIVLSLSGVLVPRTKINVTPFVPGRIVELPIEEGMRVRKGDLIARINDVNYRADLAQAQAALTLAESHLRELENTPQPEDIEKMEAVLDEAKATLELAKVQFERYAELRKTSSVSLWEYDSSRTRYRQAEAQVRRLEKELELLRRGPREEALAAARADVDRARAQLEKAQFFLENTTVKAPMDGIILEKGASLGEVVRSDYFLTSLCVLGDLSQMQAIVEVQERELQRLRIGMPCRIVPDAYPDRHYRGRLAQIQRQVNRQRGVVKVTVDVLDPDDVLLSDMNCRVELMDESYDPSADDVLVVPRTALLGAESQSPAVFVLEEGTARKRAVRIAESPGSDESGQDASSVAVTDGLQAGDVVLLVGTAERPISDGDTVEPRIQ